MSQLAVKRFCRRQLALLDVPVQAAVFSQRPRQVAVGDQAVVVITIPQSRERRLTLSRGAGRKAIVHQVRLDIYWLATDEQDGGRQFDGLLARLDQLFRATPLPAALSDPESGEQSVLTAVGEEIDTRLEPPLLDEQGEGLVAFTAEKLLTITEHVTG